MDWEKFIVSRDKKFGRYYFNDGSKIVKEIDFTSFLKNRTLSGDLEIFGFSDGRSHTRCRDGSVELKDALGEHDCDFGPAIIRRAGVKEWFKNGLRHRLDGPACESNWSSSWFVNGVMHRVDGPAYLPIQPNNLNHQPQWWVHGQRMTEAEFHECYKLAEKLQSQLEEKRPAKLIKI